MSTATNARWLCDIPTHWDVRRNGRLFHQTKLAGNSDLPILSVSLHDGVTIRDMEDDTHRQVIEDRTKYKRVAAGDLAYNMMRMWQGAVGLAPADGLVSPAYVTARPYRDVNAKYYEYLFRTSLYMGEIEGYSRGIVSDRNRLYWEEFKQMPSPYPPRDEQDAIVAFLDRKLAEIDRFIANKSSIIALLGEQKANVILEGMTTGFQSRTQTRLTGIEWLPELPDGYSVKKFKYCATVRGGQVDPRLPQFENQVLIAPNHIESKTGRLLLLETAKAQGADSGKYLVAQGDVIYSKIRPNLQKATIAPQDCLCSADMYGIRPSSELSAEYLMYWLLSPPFTAFAVEESMRVAMPKINRDSLGRAIVAFPPRTKQNAIVDEIRGRCRNLDTAVECTEKDVATMNEFRTSLITEAVTGKIDVRSRP